jgi:3-hydroxypropanoate dehydrogenase
MSAQLLRLETTACAASMARVRLDELHALLSLDPIAAAVPARTLFVVSAANKARLAASADPADRGRILSAPACAIVGYDFAFAVNIVLSACGGDGRAANDLAIRTAARGAALQGETLTRTAAALGLAATPLAHFDAAALRAGFFAGSQATVVFACRLDPDVESDDAEVIPLGGSATLTTGDTVSNYQPSWRPAPGGL